MAIAAMETPIIPGAVPQLVDAEPPAPAGNADLVEKALLQFDWENVQLGKRIMQQVLAEADRDKRVYDALPQVTEKGAEEQESDPKTPESATQSDVIRAQYNSLLFQSSDTFKAIAKQSVDQPKADTSISLIKDVWQDYGMEEEIDGSLWDYLNAPFCGLKTVIHARTEPVAVNHEVPLLKVQEFEAQMAAENKPVTIIGQDENRGMVIYEVIESRQIQDCVGEAIDPTRLYLTSRKVGKLKDVPSLHYSHVWNYEQIESAAGFRNIDKLGEPNANGRVRPTDQVPNQEDLHGQEDYTNGNFEYWEVWESWGCVPWGRWLRKGAFSYEDLKAFAERYGFDVLQCGFYGDGGRWINNNQKWRRYHKEQQPYLLFSTSYLFDKTDYPFNIASYIKGRRELIGRSYISRLFEWENMIHAGAAMLSDNIRYKLYQSVIADQLSGLDKNKWKETFKRKGFVELEIGSGRLEDMVKPTGDLFPDVTPAAGNYLNFGLSRMQTYGLPNIQMAMGDGETATQDTLNLEKSTTKITHPLRRYMDSVLIPCVEQIRDFNHQNFSGERWIAAQGEGGAAIAKEQRPVTRRDLTNRFKVISAVTYDYASRPARLNHILALLNISSQVITPTSFYKLLGAAMELMEMPREIIDSVTDNEGRGTDPQDELNAMKVNKWYQPKVRPDDDHARALIMLTGMIDEMNAANPLDEAGSLFAAQENVKMWSADHLYYFNQQQALLEQQAMMADPKGKAEQRPNDGPSDKQGQARQTAQEQSPADNAPPGMAGQASMAAVSAGNVQQPGNGL